MPRLATFSAGSYRQWVGSPINPNSHCATAGYTFPTLIPNVSDGYTLSQLGTAQSGAYSWNIDTGYIKYLINGQGKGVFGTGVAGNTTPSRYMLVYDPTGKGNYVYQDFYDCLQSGSPHEMCGVFVDGVLALGGGNEPGSPTGTANSTVRSWQVSDGRIVVLMGNAATYGHAVFQYFSYPGESIVRMQISYTNTTSSSHTVQIQRGGDPDWDQFPTYNGQGTLPVPPTNTVWSSGQRTNNTISLYTTGNGYTCNTKVSASWPLYNPNSVLAGGMDGSPGDFSIYSAWNLGTVAPGATVTVNCYYIVGVGLESFPSYICGDFVIPPAPPTPEPPPPPPVPEPTTPAYIFGGLYPSSASVGSAIFWNLSCGGYSSVNISVSGPSGFSYRTTVYPSPVGSFSDGGEVVWAAVRGTYTLTMTGTLAAGYSTGLVDISTTTFIT